MTITDDLFEEFNHLYLPSINHQLTKELCRGTLSDSRLFTYLVQDLKYFDIGLNLFAKTMTLCDNMKSKIVLGKQIGFIANDENDYFEKAIEELKLTVNDTIQDKVLPEVDQYLKYMTYLIEDSKSYPELVTALYFMEQVYLGWADLNMASVPEDLEYKYKEWIDLHSGEDFTKWTNFLRSEVDRVGSKDLKGVKSATEKVLTLELQFFDSCYNY
ncbi:protein Pet18p [[Candida] jaroonii]|uniref:Protein Pet18p n=1 Tax=[Candida] jaroonii TaxID=467808 RepID=A0ACA9YB77_9ASCO|nr:protein Pet18p [[Candida] jaroonii]